MGPYISFVVVYLAPLFSPSLRITLLCLLLFPFVFDFVNRFVPSNNYLIFPENVVIFYSLTGAAGTWFLETVCDKPRFMPYRFKCPKIDTFGEVDIHVLTIFWVKKSPLKKILFCFWLFFCLYFLNLLSYLGGWIF